MDPGSKTLRDQLLDSTKYPEYVRRFYRNRKQQHDRRGQLHSITCNPRLDEKLPMVVKFPFISEEYETMEESHDNSKHRLGMLNGLYLVPDMNTGEFVLPSVKVEQYDPLPEFWKTPRFKLLDYAFNLVYEKLSLHPVVAINTEGSKKDLTLDDKLINYSEYLLSFYFYYPNHFIIKLSTTNFHPN